MKMSHHATLIRNNSVSSVDLSQHAATSDVVDQHIEKFGIDDARALVRAAHSRPTQHDELLLIIRTDFITHESQNALLKVLEEPPVTTKFIFVVPPDFALLATLQSRFSTEFTQAATAHETNDIFQEFLTSGYADRIISIEKAVKKKDSAWQRSIKQGLIAYISNETMVPKTLKQLEYVARMLLTRGASNKMLFEHLALSLATRS
jgi:hypothetical protein